MKECVSLTGKKVWWLKGLVADIGLWGGKVVLEVSFGDDESGVGCAETLFHHLLECVPPNPEDEEATELEPEEVTVDAGGGKE